MDEINGLTPAEFAAKIKEKYPQYKDVEDNILVEKMLAKYPQYKDKLISDTAVVNDAQAKGEEAKVVSGVSDSTLAEEDTSSESKTIFDPRFPPIKDRPEYTQEEVKSAMSYVKELNKSVETGSTGEPYERKATKSEDYYLAANKALKDDEEDGGILLKEKAIKKIQEDYTKLGITDYQLDDNIVTEEAIRIKEKESAKKISKQVEQIINANTPKEQRSYLSNLLDNVAAGSAELGIMIASIPETLYDVAAIPQNFFSKVTGIDIEASSSKFKGDYDISNPLLDLYVEESERIQETIADFNTRYESTSVAENLRKGNWADAFELLGASIAQSAPVSVGMMAGGAALSTGKLVGYGTVAFTGKNRMELDDEHPEMSEIEKTVKSLGLAGAETVFSSISQGSLGKVYKDIITKEGIEGGKIIFKDGLIKMYQEALKKYGAIAGALGEGIEEVATTITQNMINNRPAFENIADSFIQGVGGGTLYGSPITAKKVATHIKGQYDKRQVNKILESDTNNYVKITDAFLPKGSEMIGDKLKLVQKPKAYEMLTKELENQVKNGEIDEATAEGSKKDFLNTTLTLSKTAGIELSEADRTEAVKLITEKEKLKEDIKNMDDVLASSKKERVAKIDEQLKGLTEKSKQDGKRTEGKQEPRTKGVDGKDVGTTKVDETTKTTETKQGDVQAKSKEEVKQREAYTQELKQTKEENPTDYWSVSEVDTDTEGTVIEVEGGKGFVGTDGDIKGVFKSPTSTAKNVADKILQEAVKKGGKMLDNFDNHLTKIYKRNGFRVVSRTPFNKEYAPEGWNEAEHGTPDVVAMVYDPNGTMDIEEKKFDDYQDMIDYRNSVLEEGEQKAKAADNITLEESTNEKGEVTVDSVMDTWLAKHKALTARRANDEISQTEMLSKQKELVRQRKEVIKQMREAEQLTNELEDFVNGANPNLQLDSKETITTEEKKQALVEEATKLMEEVEGEGFTEEAFTAEKPAPKVVSIPIVIKENSKLAKKVKRMGLKELIGKKINLVMADQLKVGSTDVNGKKLNRMGGHFFPLMDKLFGKVAWASINKTAASSIVNGAIKSDYTVVYNMNPTAIDSNLAMLETTIEAIKALPTKVNQEIFSGIKEYLQTVKFGEKKTALVHKLAKESKNFNELAEAISKLDVDTKAGILNKILPSKGTTASTPIGRLLQENNIDIEDIRALNIEQFVEGLPAGAMTMVLEVTDKAGNKVTEKTKGEALITQEQQDAEGLPRHQNYPVYVRGKAIAILDETVPFWNMFKTAMSSINAKVAGVVKNRGSYEVVDKGGKNVIVKETLNFDGSRLLEKIDGKNTVATKKVSGKDKTPTKDIIEKEFGKIVKQKSSVSTRSSASAISDEMRSAAMTANKAKPMTESDTTMYEKFVSLIGRAFPTVEVITDTAEFSKLMNNLTAKALTTKNGKVYGAVYQGKLYLNSAMENFNTPIHEYGHIWLNTVKEANKELYNKGMSLVKGSEYESSIRASKEYTKVTKQMLKEGATQEEVDNYIYEEALATAIGDKGESFVVAAQKNKFSNWLNNLYSFVRKLTGISKYSAEQLQDITLSEFTQAVAVDIMSGNELFKKGQVKTLTNALQLMTGSSKSIESIVEFAREKGYEDNIIKIALAKQGFSKAESEIALATIIPKAIAKSAAEAVRSNKVSNLKADVDNVGIEHVKSTKWYKSLTTTQKDTLNRKGIASILGDMEASLRKGSQPTKEGKEFRDTVKDVTGQTDKSKTVVSTEAKLLKDKFKAMERGAKIGADEMKRLKSEFVKEISSKLKEVVDSKSMSLAEAKRILSAVNQLNFNNYDRVAPLVDKVIDAIENKGVRRQIKQGKTALRKAAKSQRNPVNMRELAKESLKVNEAYLTPEERVKYRDLLEKIQAGFKAATNKGYVLPHEARILNSLENLNQLAEHAKLLALADSMGVDVTGLKTSEIMAILEAENVDEYVDNLSEEKKKQARELLEKQAEYARIALNDVDTTDMSEQEIKAIKELKNADLSLLSSTDVRDLIKIVDNIVTNKSFASSGNLVSKVRAYTASNEAVGMFHKEDLSMIRKTVITDLKSMALILKKVFMNTKKAAMFNKLSGLTKLGMAYTKHKHAMNALTKSYDELFSKLKKEYKGLDKPQNTLLRGVIGQLIQGTTEEDFAINKSRMEDHIKKAKSAQSYDTRLGIDILEEQYNRVKDLKSQDEVIEFAKGLNDGNWQLVEFWLNHFENQKEALKYNTETVHGKSFEEVVGNYLPIKMKSDGSTMEDIDNLPFFDRNGLPASNASPTTIKRAKTKKLPAGRLLDLDFDSVMFNKASAVSIDVETSSAYKDVYNFFKSANMDKMFGAETLAVFNTKLAEMRKVQLGISSAGSLDELTKAITKVESIWKTVATTIGLGSITQYPKQYISVAFNVMSHLGSQSDLMFKAMFTDKSKIPLLDMVSISLRGETQGGTVEAGTRISEAEKRATTAIAGKVANVTGEAANKIREVLFYSLRKGDTNVAKSSWIAFYQKYLNDKGITDIDMTTEHERMEDPVRQEAISYAELKVEETQISSDESRGSEFYQSKSIDRSILRSIFLPYQSFNINSKMRMMNDLGILGSRIATKEDKKEAASSLIGTTAEIVTFQTMKYYVLAQVFALGKSALESLFGLDTPDEDEEAKAEFTFKQWYSALAKDLNPLSIGSFAEDMSIEVLNLFQYLAEAEDDEAYMDFIKRVRDDGGQMFYRYKDKEERGQAFGASLLGGGGLYQIPYTQSLEMLDNFELMNSHTRRDDYGNLYEYNFDENQITFLQASFAVEFISMFGLGEADSRRIMRKMRRDITKNTKKQKIN